MKRRNFLRHAGLGVAAGAAATLAAPAIAQTNPALRWRLQSGFPKTLSAIYSSGEILARHVSDLTDGQFQIQSFASGEIVAPGQIADAVGNNTIEMALTAPQYYHGKDPTFTLPNGIPFGPNTRMFNAWQLEGGGMELINQFYAKHNIYGLPGGLTGGQMGGWYRKEINSLTDMQGLKLRIGGLAGTILSKFGVVPSAIPGSDVYVALERGTIDAAEFTGPLDDERLGFVRVAPYYYFPGFWEGAASLNFFVNLDHWNDLPKHYRAAITVAAEAANQRVLAQYDAGNPKSILRLIAEGAQLRAFPQEVLDAAFGAAQETYAELSASNENWKTIFDSMMAFRNEGYAWWQVTEFNYDAMMIRMRDRL